MDATSAQTVTINNNNKTSTSTCTATFDLNTYSINYDLNGGYWFETVSASSIPSFAGYDSIFVVPNPTKDGYKFYGWNISNGLSTSTALSGATAEMVVVSIGSSSHIRKGPYFKSLTKGESVTLRANWLDIEDGGGSETTTYYRVSFKGNSNCYTPDSITFKEGEKGTVNISPCATKCDDLIPSSISCTNNFQVNGFKSDYKSTQTITISKGSSTSSVCTIYYDSVGRFDCE